MGCIWWKYARISSSQISFRGILKTPLYCKYALSSGDSEADVLEVSRICLVASWSAGEHISKTAPNPGESPSVSGQLQVKKKLARWLQTSVEWRLASFVAFPKDFRCDFDASLLFILTPRITRKIRDTPHTSQLRMHYIMRRRWIGKWIKWKWRLGYQSSGIWVRRAADNRRSSTYMALTKAISISDRLLLVWEKSSHLGFCRRNSTFSTILRTTYTRDTGHHRTTADFALTAILTSSSRSIAMCRHDETSCQVLMYRSAERRSGGRISASFKSYPR